MDQGLVQLQFATLVETSKTQKDDNHLIKMQKIVGKPMFP